MDAILVTVLYIECFFIPISWKIKFSCLYDFLEIHSRHLFHLNLHLTLFQFGDFTDIC